MRGKRKPIRNIGQLIAVSENGDSKILASEEMQRVLNIRRKYSIKQVEVLATELEGKQCSEKSEHPDECILLFLAFMDASIPKETAGRLFNHLSTCYACFDEFASNWTAYLAAHES